MSKLTESGNINKQAMELFQYAFETRDSDSLIKLQTFCEDAVEILKLVTLRKLKFEDLAISGKAYGANLQHISVELAIKCSDCFIDTFNNKKMTNFEHIIVALGEIHTPESLQLIINSLQNSSEWIRSPAVRALGKFPKSEVSIQALTNALKDREYLVQYHSLASLGKVGDFTTIAIIEPFTRSENRGLQIVSKDAIKQILQRCSNEQS